MAVKCCIADGQVLEQTIPSHGSLALRLNCRPWCLWVLEYWRPLGQSCERRKIYQADILFCSSTSCGLFHLTFSRYQHHVWWGACACLTYILFWHVPPHKPNGRFLSDKEAQWLLGTSAFYYYSTTDVKHPTSMLTQPRSMNKQPAERKQNISGIARTQHLPEVETTVLTASFQTSQRHCY